MAAKQHFCQNNWGEYFCFILSGDEFRIWLKLNYRYKCLMWICRLCDPVVFSLFFCAAILGSQIYLMVNSWSFWDIVKTEVLIEETKLQINKNLVYAFNNLYFFNICNSVWSLSYLFANSLIPLVSSYCMMCLKSPRVVQCRDWGTARNALCIHWRMHGSGS